MSIVPEPLSRGAGSRRAAGRRRRSTTPSSPSTGWPKSAPCTAPAAAASTSRVGCAPASTREVMAFAAADRNCRRDGQAAPGPAVGRGRGRHRERRDDNAPRGGGLSSGASPRDTWQEGEEGCGRLQARPARRLRRARTGASEIRSGPLVCVAVWFHPGGASVQRHARARRK